MSRSASSRFESAFSSRYVVLYSFRWAYASANLDANAAKRSAIETVAVRLSVINAIVIVFRLRLSAGGAVLLCPTIRVLLQLHNGQGHNAAMQKMHKSFLPNALILSHFH